MISAHFKHVSALGDGFPMSLLRFELEYPLNDIPFFKDKAQEQFTKFRVLREQIEEYFKRTVDMKVIAAYQSHGMDLPVVEYTMEGGPRLTVADSFLMVNAAISAPHDIRRDKRIASILADNTRYMFYDGFPKDRHFPSYTPENMREFGVAMDDFDTLDFLAAILSAQFARPAPEQASKPHI